MKAKKAIREALKQPWLYNDEELKTLKDKLRDLEGMGVQELWHRRTTMGFSNEPEMLNEQKTILDKEVKGRYSCAEVTDKDNVSTERLPL